MDDKAVLVLYVALQTTLLSAVRYWLYQDNLRIPIRRMYAILAAASFSVAILWLVTGGIPGLSFAYFRSLFAVLMYLLSCFLIREPFAKHTLSYGFIMAYDATFEATANYLCGLLSPQGSSLIYVAVAAPLLAVSFVPCARALKRTIDRLSALENDRIFGQMCVICFSFLFMNLLFTFPATGRMTLLTLFSRYLMFLGVVGVYAAATRVMETMQTSAEAKAQLMLSERRIAMQQSYYDRLIAQMDEVRRMRHDFRHHRAVLTALLNDGNIDALSSYLDAADLAEETPPVTGNLVADAVLLYYLDAAKALGVQVETDLQIGRSLPLSDPDLCVILGNLLENAVEAQRYVPIERRFLRATARVSDTGLTLAVDNRFDGICKVEGGEYLSRKEGSGHGMGLGSVRAVCEKNGGVLQIETEGDLFMAGVVIGL